MPGADMYFGVRRGGGVSREMITEWSSYMINAMLNLNEMNMISSEQDLNKKR